MLTTTRWPNTLRAPYFFFMKVSHTTIVFVCSMFAGAVIAIWSAPVGVLVNNIAVVMLLMEVHRLEARTTTADEQNRMALKEAGAAITDTLRVAFSGLKRDSILITKQGNTTSDHARRIHRLEQIVQKMAGKHNIQIAQERVEEKTSPRLKPQPLNDNEDEK